MKVKFLKRRFFKNRYYEIGETVKIDDPILLRTFLGHKVVEYVLSNNQEKTIDFNKMTYRQLQNECKKRKLPAVGKREDMIHSLIEKQ